MGDEIQRTTWSRRICERCGIRSVVRRKVCAECLAALELEAAKSPDAKHLALLRATGRDYAGRKL